MGVSSRLRHELARRPWIYWMVVAGAVVVAVLASVEVVGRADAERARWGSTAAVLVATSTIEPGTAVQPRVEVRQYPVAVIPDQSIGALEAGSVARRTIVAGAIVTSADVGAGQGPAALARAGEVVVAVRESVPSEARVGERVMIASDGIVLADDALLVGETAEGVLVAVDRSAAPMVAAAAGSPGGIALLRIP